MEARGIEDLTSLQRLTADSIVDSLKSRWSSGHCYTYVGDVLVAVNPNRRLNIYSEDQHKLYEDTLSRSKNPPHIFWTGNHAYQRMRTSGRDQIVLISGESGAGKTESTKYILEHVSYVCQHQADKLHEKLNSINPLLEAFGNAKTAMNENSSRFGKYIELAFNNNGSFKGARIATYILEKSRVTHHSIGEKNFHIFYCLLAGLKGEERAHLGLEDVDNYRMMWPSDAQGKKPTPAFQDQDEYDRYGKLYGRLMRVMQSIGFAREDADFLNEILAAILHLTNITFVRAEYHDDGVEIQDERVLHTVARLLRVDLEHLRTALLGYTYEIRGVPNHGKKDFEQAEEGRDSLARSLYQGLFSSLVEKVNSHLQGSAQARPQAQQCIGVLDMSGFEDLETNGFDQLLINVANERLQFYFNEYLFSREQREMDESGIDWSNIHYENNQDILALFFGDRSSRDAGMLDVIDEESTLRQSSDGNLLARLHHQFGNREAYQRPIYNESVFTIQHFAGDVKYNVEGFLEKNRDHLGHDFIRCISTSRKQQVSHLVDNLRHAEMYAGSASRGKKQRTASKQFKDSLGRLVDRLSQSQALFVRCIRPNSIQHSNEFDKDLVAKQLSYNGLLELAKMRRIGFPIRMDFQEFLDRYQILQFRQATSPLAQECENILLMADLQDAQVGLNKVFLKEWHKDQLDQQLNHLKTQVMFVQRRRRGQLRGERFISVVEQAMARKSQVKNYNQGLPEIPSRFIDGASMGSGEETAEPSPASSQSNDSQSQQETQEDQFDHLPRESWDLFRHILYESDAADRRSDKILQVIKAFFYLLFFVIMLGGLVFNKLSLLLMTSNLSYLLNPELQEPNKEPYILRERDNHIIFLVICLSIPYVLTVVRYGIRILGESLPKIRFSVLIQFIIVESMHICGVCLLVYWVLPCLDMVRGLFILSLTCSLPGLFKIFFARSPIGRSLRPSSKAAYTDDQASGGNNNEQQVGSPNQPSKHEKVKHTACQNAGKGFWYLFNIFAFLVQVGGLVVYTIGGFETDHKRWKEDVISGNTPNQTYTSLSYLIFYRPETDKFSNFRSLWELPLSLFLISVKWWENFVDRDLKLFGCCTIPILSTKAKWHKHRTKATFLASVVSLFLLCCSPFILFNNFTYRAPGIKRTDTLERVKYWQNPMINIGSSIIVYAISVIVSKVCMQKFCFNFAMVLATPATLTLIMLRCILPPIDLSQNAWFCPEVWTNIFDNNYTIFHIAVLVAVWLSSLIIAGDTWWSFQNRLDITEKLFVAPFYSPAVLEQSMSLNRRRIDDSVVLRHGLILLKAKELENLKKETKKGKKKRENKKNAGKDKKDRQEEEEIVPMVYACATLWHETVQEMTQLTKSIFRMDKHQSARRLQKKTIGLYDPEYFDFQTHILFDDAFTDAPDGTRDLNSFVQDFIGVIDVAGSSIHECPIALASPIRIVTPYGGRLIYSLPGGTLLIVHLKDKNKIRHRKRWSQCMYMYYLLAYRLVAMTEEDVWKNMTSRAGGDHNAFSRTSIFNRFPEEVIRKADNTFILALDGDVDFKPDAVRLLMDLMKKNKNVASACGRIHPIGTGPMIWYQIFGYAIAHWLQKVVEHVFGCVLCSPGCFSLFRGSALMDDNVMRRYLTTAREPREFIQFDQGEDRWLCTLLIQQGYRIEYCAGSDALTFAPESLSEYFTQQRRWISSTMANILDLLSSYQTTIEKNRDISHGFMGYQLILFVATLLAPATIIVLLGGSYNALLGTGLLESYLLGLSTPIFYTLICVTCKGQTQINVGIFLSGVYSIVMMLVLVALIVNSTTESISNPNVAFFIAIILLNLITGALHPREILALAPGILYMFAIPFSLLFLIIYSLCNMHVVSWGTREVKREKTPEELEEERLEEEKRKLKAKSSGVLNMLGLGKTFDDLREFAATVVNKKLLAPEHMADDGRLKKVEELLQIIVEEDKKPAVRNELREILKKKNSEIAVEGSSKPAIPPKSANINRETKLPPPPVPSEPHWTKDELITAGKAGQINPKEDDFWKAMLKYYLHPIDSNKQQEKADARALLDLRNSVVIGLAMLNLMWIILILLFQVLKESIGEALFIPIPLEEGKIEFFEPVGLIFLCFYALLLSVQFIATLIHRVNTILHLIAITNVRWPWSKHINSEGKELEDAITLITKLQSIENPDLELFEPTTDYDSDEDTYGQEVREDERTEYSLIGGYGRDPHHGGRYRPHGQELEPLDQFGLPTSFDNYGHYRNERRHHGQASWGYHPGIGTRDIGGGTLGHVLNRRITRINRQRSRGADARYTGPPEEEYYDERDRRYKHHSNYREMLGMLDRRGRRY